MNVWVQCFFTELGVSFNEIFSFMYLISLYIMAKVIKHASYPYISCMIPRIDANDTLEYINQLKEQHECMGPMFLYRTRRFIQ